MGFIPEHAGKKFGSWTSIDMELYEIKILRPRTFAYNFCFREIGVFFKAWIGPVTYDLRKVYIILIHTHAKFKDIV